MLESQLSKSSDSNGMVEAITQQFKKRLEQTDVDLTAAKKARDELDA